FDALAVDRVALSVVVFFFRAEDGIRDFHVTGVQTCALPIYRAPHDILDFERVRMKDLLRNVDQLIGSGVADFIASGRVHHAKVDVQADQISAFAGNQKDVAFVCRLNGSLDADVREVVDSQDIHDAPGVVGNVAVQFAAYGCSYHAARAVGAYNI